MQSEVEGAGEDVLTHLLRNIPNYPPPLPGSKYIRTYNLSDALEEDKGEHEMSLSEMKPMGDGAQVILGVSEYGPYVVGQSHQVTIHEGRWFTLSEILTDNEREILNIVRRHIRMAKRRAGF